MAHKDTVGRPGCTLSAASVPRPWSGARLILVNQPQNFQCSEEKPGGICITWTLQGLVRIKSPVGPICCPSRSCAPPPTFMPFYMLEKLLLLVGSQGVTQAWFESQIPALPFTIWITEQASSTSLNLVYLFCKMQVIIITYFSVTSYRAGKETAQRPK